MRTLLSVLELGEILTAHLGQQSGVQQIKIQFVDHQLVWIAILRHIFSLELAMDFVAVELDFVAVELDFVAVELDLGEQNLIAASDR